MLRHWTIVVSLVTLVNLSPGQTGPWTDGELLVRSVASPSSQVQTIYRVIPETGNGAALISGFYWAGTSSSMVFDPYRDGVLASMGMPPSLFNYALWVISSDGNAVSIPGFSGHWYRALTPVGDGRVYYQRASSNPTHEIHYLDANNTDQTLMDQTGTAPFLFHVERMLYHAPTNSLIASASGWYSSNNCTTNMTSFFRIPLSADGTRVDGPVVCGNLSVANVVMGMDYMPGGNIFLTLAGSQYYHDTLLVLDPMTLTSTVYASPGPSDLNGGVWSARVGKAVILDDWSNVLRSYSPGQTGNGQVIASNVTVSPNTTGYSATETMVEIDVNGPGCNGGAAQFGVGLAGTGGIVPTLGVVGCPDIGTSFTIAADQAVGGASGFLAASTLVTSFPVVGGTLYVYPPQVLLPVFASGTPGVGGAGSYGLPVLISDPSLTGVSLYLQAAFIDGAAVQSVSLTQGLVITFG